MTGTVHVRVGTDERLVCRNLSAQLSRRRLDRHFPRDAADRAEARRAFQSVLWAFQRQLPVADEPDLLRHWASCYERSVGCVGVLKDWLTRALAAALDEDAASLTLAHLQRTALSAAQCVSMAAEATEGEARLAAAAAAAAADGSGMRPRLRALLGLVAPDGQDGRGATASGPPSPARSASQTGPQPPGPATVAAARSRTGRVGQRRPTRDPVGPLGRGDGSGGRDRGAPVGTAGVAAGGEVAGHGG